MNIFFSTIIISLIRYYLYSFETQSTVNLVIISIVHTKDYITQILYLRYFTTTQSDICFIITNRMFDFIHIINYYCNIKIKLKISLQ